ATRPRAKGSIRRSIERTYEDRALVRTAQGSCRTSARPGGCARGRKRSQMRRAGAPWWRSRSGPCACPGGHVAQLLLGDLEGLGGDVGAGLVGALSRAEQQLWCGDRELARGCALRQAELAVGLGAHLADELQAAVEADRHALLALLLRALGLHLADERLLAGLVLHLQGALDLRAAGVGVGRLERAEVADPVEGVAVGIVVAHV